MRRCETRRTSGEWVKLKARVGVDTVAANDRRGREGDGIGRDIWTP